MLCQLVCVDRRYQRMNCFNIRELQGILKRKFFTDLVNSNDHRMLLDKSIIGLRFKTNNNNAITHDMYAFFELGTTNSTHSKTNSLVNTYNNIIISTFFKQNWPLNINLFDPITVLSNTLNNILFSVTAVFRTIASISMATFSSFAFIPFLLNDFVSINFNPFLTNNLSITNSTSSKDAKSLNYDVNYLSENINNNSESYNSLNFLSETSSTFRFTRFNNPLISYDYKCGNYLGI